MKLFASAASPFVRKVLVVAHELGLADRVQVEHVALSPIAPNAELNRRNPLGKIPALELDDGAVLYDSRVICEYLDALAVGRKVIPATSAERFAALRTQALADGVLDAGILLRYETILRPEEQRSAAWMDGQAEKVLAGLRELERSIDTSAREPNIGDIAAAVALGWLAFRAPLATRPAGGVDVKEAFASLFAWYDELSKRPSFAGTHPSA